MAHPTQQTQSQHVAYCVVSAGGNLRSLIVAALNAQAAGRGDRIAEDIIGVRVISAAANFTLSNADGTGTVTVQSSLVPFDIPATSADQDTVVSAVSLGLAVFYNGVDRV